MKRLLVRCTNDLWELLLAYVVVVLSSAWAFSAFERDVGFWRSVYWAIVTSTTLGYGDLYPKTLGGMIVMSALLIVTLFFLIPLIIAHVIKAVTEDANAFTHEEQLRLEAKVDALLRDHNLDPESFR